MIDADIPYAGRYQGIGIMRADIDSGQHRVLQILQIVFTNQLERLTRMGHAHDQCFTPAFELHGLQTSFRRKNLTLGILHEGAFHFTPLQSDQPVNMGTGIHADGISSNRFPDHPSDLAMTYGS